MVPLWEPNSVKTGKQSPGWGCEGLYDSSWLPHPLFPWNFPFRLMKFPVAMLCNRYTARVHSWKLLKVPEIEERAGVSQPTGWGGLIPHHFHKKGSRGNAHGISHCLCSVITRHLQSFSILFFEDSIQSSPKLAYNFLFYDLVSVAILWLQDKNQFCSLNKPSVI